MFCTCYFQPFCLYSTAPVIWHLEPIQLILFLMWPTPMPRLLYWLFGQFFVVWTLGSRPTRCAADKFGKYQRGDICPTLQQTFGTTCSLSTNESMPWSIIKPFFGMSLCQESRSGCEICPFSFWRFVLEPCIKILESQFLSCRKLMKGSGIFGCERTSKTSKNKAPCSLGPAFYV